MYENIRAFRPHVHALRAGLLVTALASVFRLAAGVAPALAAAPPAAVPTENPLRTADQPTRTAALNAAWTTFQRSCRPCHGSLGGGDGPFAFSFPQKAADLRRPSREVVPDATRFARIRDGAATLGDRAWESNMPAFGDDLDSQAIWGLVLLLEELGKEGSGVDVDASGAQMYEQRCAVCHGANGAGDGPLAPESMPPPTDFVHGAYRIRSTPYGAAPLDSDIIGATANGVGDTTMGRFLTLGADRLDMLTKHLMSFNQKLFETLPDTLSGSPIPPGSTLALAGRGRTVYDEAKCSECHGLTGRGDGPGGLALKDDQGHPSIPTNLTMRWKFKFGAGANDVFRSLLAGLNGTPMKSYAATLSSDDRWALAHYLDRIARPRPRYAPTIHAAVVTEKLPLDPNDAFWKPLLPATVTMGPQVEFAPYWTAPAVENVDVAVAANKDELGILLVWDDRSRDVRKDEEPAATVAAAMARYGGWKLPDGIAVEFPDRLDAKSVLPPSFLGNAKRGVRRWRWSADRQEQSEATASVETFKGPRSAPIAATDVPTVRTAAAYADGQWRVLMIGKRPPEKLTTLPIALQAWDGSSGEAGNWVSLSSWMNVDLR